MSKAMHDQGGYGHATMPYTLHRNMNVICHRVTLTSKSHALFTPFYYARQPYVVRFYQRIDPSLRVLYSFSDDRMKCPDHKPSRN